MKPIRLKIKGLNSFIEEQEIDFNELTKCGFFGVFGKTGSGKSTILDALTLALYGEISRKSLNFINANCTSANVSFEFHISSDVVHEYLVMREFRLDKKMQTPRAYKCKLIEKTGGTEEILADSVREVTDRCTEIIGLGLEDFMRTVVLPQGKFSEFLKLSGKPRRNMLERLFQLQKYGDQLTQKINRATRQLEDQLHSVEGELKGYDEVNEEKLKGLMSDHKELLANVQKLMIEYEALSKKQLEAKEIRSLLEEKACLEEEEKKHTLKLVDIKEKREKLRLGRKAILLYPNIQKEAQTRKNLDTEKEKLEELTIKHLNAELEYRKAETDEKEAVRIKDDRLPKLEVIRNDIKTAREEFLKNKDVHATIKVKINEYKDKKQELDKLQAEITKHQEEKTSLSNQVSQADIKFQDLKIDITYKKQIEQGKRYLEDQERCIKTKQELEAELLSFRKENDSLTIRYEELQRTNQKLSDELQSIENALKSLVNPGNVSELEEYGRKENELRRCLEEYKKSLVVKEETKKRMDVISGKSEELTLLESDLASQEEKLTKKVKEVEKEHLSRLLREGLSDGEPCPVCGSTHHVRNDTMYEVSDREDWSDELEKVRQERSIQKGKLLEYQIEYSHLQKIFDEERRKQSELGTPSEKALEEISILRQTLKSSMETYNINKESLTLSKENAFKKLSECNQNMTAIHASITSNQVVIEEKENKKRLNEEQLQIINKQISELEDTTTISDFALEYDNIFRIEKERDTMEQMLKTLRRSYEEEVEKLQKLEEKRELATLYLTTLQGEIEAKQKEWKEIEQRILKLLNGRRDMDVYEQEICNEIKGIDTTCQRLMQQKNEKQVFLKKLEEDKLKSTTLVEEYQTSMLALLGEVEEGMVQYQFANRDEVRVAYIEPDLMETLQIEIDLFEKHQNEIKTKINSLSDKLAGRTLSVSEYECIKTELEEKTLILEQGKEELSILKEKILNIKNALITLKEKIKQKEEIIHRLGIHGELEKLLRGNRFVEYVALERLQYISKEASRRLSEISNGIYGLEINEDGEFLIQDNKNGGVLRDASTLSGGETFIASLSLALALSSEIQLKGAAPLELFFLDEGFGSLDEDMLEVVISSLERIHHDKLKIGLISHIETVKNRVPVKLLVTPAQSGMGGSKVKVEYS